MTPNLHFPLLFFPVALLLAGLLGETWFQRGQPWAWPAAFLYVTIFVWYFVDLYITPEDYETISDRSLNFSYGQVAAFLVTYRLLLPGFTRVFTRRAERVAQALYSPGVNSLFTWSVMAWFCLLVIGVARMNGDVLRALFPLDARAGELLWERAAAGDAGASGFLVSTAGYIYLLLCASFGVWLFFLRTLPMRIAAIGMILISWPFFLLSGTRSIFLGVCMPFFFAYLIFGRQPLALKCLCLCLALLAMQSTLLVVGRLRNVGFRGLFDAEQRQEITADPMRVQGLNMIAELCYVNEYATVKSLPYGARYLQEVVNFIPRAIWASKPMPNLDYAKWRGFEGGDSDIGVVATISSGMIGGGVMNFGPYVGPFAPAVLVAAWSSLLARWWLQRALRLRCSLFLIGLGLTFNLGRDITLLVLWPIVFGYLIVRLIEVSRGPKRSKSRSTGQPTAVAKPAAAGRTLPAQSSLRAR